MNFLKVLRDTLQSEQNNNANSEFLEGDNPNVGFEQRMPARANPVGGAGMPNPATGPFASMEDALKRNFYQNIAQDNSNKPPPGLVNIIKEKLGNVAAGGGVDPKMEADAVPTAVGAAPTLTAAAGGVDPDPRVAKVGGNKWTPPPITNPNFTSSEEVEARLPKQTYAERESGLQKKLLDLGPGGMEEMHKQAEKNYPDLAKVRQGDLAHHAEGTQRVTEKTGPLGGALAAIFWEMQNANRDQFKDEPYFSGNRFSMEDIGADAKGLIRGYGNKAVEDSKRFPWPRR